MTIYLGLRGGAAFCDFWFLMPIYLGLVVEVAPHCWMSQPFSHPGILIIQHPTSSSSSSSVAGRATIDQKTVCFSFPSSPLYKFILCAFSLDQVKLVASWGRLLYISTVFYSSCLLTERTTWLTLSYFCTGALLICPLWSSGWAVAWFHFYELEFGLSFAPFLGSPGFCVAWQVIAAIQFVHFAYVLCGFIIVDFIRPLWRNFCRKLVSRSVLVWTHCSFTFDYVLPLNWN